MTNKIIYFDMDGTLADLYSVDNVFKKLDSYDVSPYIDAKPINKYINLLKEYKNNGYTIQYPIKDEDGDIDFCGKKFSLHTQKIGGDLDVDFE